MFEHLEFSSRFMSNTRGGHSTDLKIQGAGSIVLDLEFWLGKYILGHFKNST